MNKNYFIILAVVVIIYLLYKTRESFSCSDPSNVVSIKFGDNTRCFSKGIHNVTDFSNNSECNIEILPNVEVSLYNDYISNHNKTNVPTMTLNSSTKLYGSCYPKRIEIK